MRNVLGVGWQSGATPRRRWRVRISCKGSRGGGRCTMDHPSTGPARRELTSDKLHHTDAALALADEELEVLEVLERQVRPAQPQPRHVPATEHVAPKRRLASDRRSAPNQARRRLLGRPGGAARTPCSRRRSRRWRSSRRRARWGGGPGCAAPRWTSWRPWASRPSSSTACRRSWPARPIDGQTQRQRRRQTAGGLSGRVVAAHCMTQQRHARLIARRNATTPQQNKRQGGRGTLHCAAQEPGRHSR